MIPVGFCFFAVPIVGGDDLGAPLPDDCRIPARCGHRALQDAVQFAAEQQDTKSALHGRPQVAPTVRIGSDVSFQHGLIAHSDCFSFPTEVK